MEKAHGNPFFVEEVTEIERVEAQMYSTQELEAAQELERDVEMGESWLNAGVIWLSLQNWEQATAAFVQVLHFALSDEQNWGDCSCRHDSNV